MEYESSGAGCTLEHRRLAARRRWEALGALDADEATTMERHLEGCERCQEEARWLEPALQTLPETCLRLSQLSLNEEQMQCMRHLQDDVMMHLRPKAASTLEESDAEEELSGWLAGLGVKDGWKLARLLVAAGWRKKEVECRRGRCETVRLSETIQRTWVCAV